MHDAPIELDRAPPWRRQAVEHAPRAHGLAGGTNWRVTHVALANCPGAARHRSQLHLLEDDRTETALSAGVQARPGDRRTRARRSWARWVLRLASGAGCGVPVVEPPLADLHNTESRAFASAVPSHACGTCVVRHGLAGSARVVELCDARRAGDQSARTTAPTPQMRAVSLGRRCDRPRRTPSAPTGSMLACRPRTPLHGAGRKPAPAPQMRRRVSARSRKPRT